MAMYYYASKLNEASCSGCSVKVPPVSEPATTSTDFVPLTVDPALLHGSGLSYYDNDDYYSMVRGNKLMSESSCKHMVMNGGLGYMSAQKVEPGQNQGNGGVSVGMGVGGGEEVEYRDGQLVSASLEALVDMLRPGAPPSFTFTFLLCSRLFLKPHELLAKLCKRYFKNYDKPGKADESKECPEKELADMGALVRVLTQWTGMFPYDFRDDRVMALVRTITQRCASEQMAGMRSEVSRTLERLLDRLTALEQYEQSLPEPAPLCTVEQLPQGDILTLGLSPVELARQLTAVELYRLSFVGPEEFLQAFSPPAAKTPAAPKTTRNLEAYADWFNRLSYLVATDIIKPVKSKQRARLLEQWVTTARECFNLGNFNSLMAIISALNMAPIARLKKTWSRASPVCGQQLRQLELCVEPGGNHARYRAALAAAPGETAVPLLSVTCRDLHFAHQSAPTRVSGGRVNFEKCCALARPVRAQLAARRLGETHGTPHRPAHAVNAHVTNTPTWRFFLDRPALSETALELVSFEREPPADHLEKERLKRLKGAAP
ncbi:ras-GEF domain-containing family member 1B [Papilio machaon]|nr:ras-GEF domain-containing family member 1B [Papilio machaon]